MAKNNYFILDVNEERLTLPHLRPPDFKISFWQVLKDLIGKDLTKVSLPVYFNEPLSIIQKVTESIDFNDILERAALEPDPLMRLALVSAFNISRSSSATNRT